MKADAMQRRSFLTLLGSAAAAWPMAARAQRRTMPVIGLLGSGIAEVYSNSIETFRRGIQEAGFVESQNIRFEYRWANNQFDRLPAMVADLIRSNVTLIFTIGNSLPTLAAKNATTTIPIVFSMGADPVQIGVVSSLNRPGGNITGVVNLIADLIGKRMQLLHELVPTATFGCLYNPGSQGRSSNGRTALEMAQDSARALGHPIVVEQARTLSDFDAAFANLVENGAEAMFTTGEALFSGAERLIALPQQYRKPMIYHGSPQARAGGLMSYSASFADSMRQAGRYAGRILKGEKPADLPVLLPTKFEFVLNLKTAKALGLTFPPGLLAIADEVIE